MRYTKEYIIKYLQDGIDSGEIKNTTSLNIKLCTILRQLNCNSWEEVLKIIGRENVLKTRKFLNKEQIENTIWNLIKEKGKLPTTREIWKIAQQDKILRLYGNMDNFYSIFKEYIVKKEELKYTKEELIKYLQNKIDSGEIKNTAFFTKKENIDLNVVFRRLNCSSWEEVLILINRTYLIPSKKEDFKNKEEIKKFYIELSNSLNKPFGASLKDIQKYSKYKTPNIVSIFGGMSGLREEVGIPNIYNKIEFNYRKIRTEFSKIYKEIGKLPYYKMEEELKKREFPSLTTVKRAFNLIKLKDIYNLLDKKIGRD
ncbi:MULTISPECIES: hypothetical protein [Fusobacterium]|uniref:hypothetical protein n=1 Tax=Fusobacterium TaxID=848 RepID=UPI0025B8A0D9|nr:hypothetical protein [Fusobacterium sp.]MCI7223703.1 hypothetical protein [Fusobacterium sp.]MDD7411260.1 hypothetical protein [Fusobacteriaceae bacterium]MDY5713614.1 hypothetical protein [Fusobacterium gastrosuis]